MYQYLLSQGKPVIKSVEDVCVVLGFVDVLLSTPILGLY